MRFVTWNCRNGGFPWKAKRVAALRPDILAVQEVRPLDDVLLFDRCEQPRFRDRAPRSVDPGRGVGMFSFTHLEMAAVDHEDMLKGFRRYEVQREDLKFNVVPAWTWWTKDRESRYRQVHEGLRRHAAWIQERPTVVLGDFNANASYRGPNWRNLLELAESAGLVSAYHHHFGERPGAESRGTYFHRGKEDHGFHVDYCLLPLEWAQHVNNVNVPRCAEWRDISDHVPLVVDLRF